MPVYPVYQWIPLNGCENYEVELMVTPPASDENNNTQPAKNRQWAQKVEGAFSCYDESPRPYAGEYYWRVRAIDANGNTIGTYSDVEKFTVKEKNSRIFAAAFGDSITHGGGAITVPPSYQLYDWESYCTVPVKNLGRSGDTTEAMLERFERDVLPFSPRVLLIMGGVNDYRSGIYGAESVRNLTALRDKCKAYGITPVFLTATPIHPALMTSRMTIAPPPSDWWAHRDYINHWIMQQEYSIDVSGVLSDEDGTLEPAYTTDGLHPDLMGKKYIGERVDAYLREHFAYAAGMAERRIRALKQTDP